MPSAANHRLFESFPCTAHTSNCPAIGRPYFCLCECRYLPVLACLRRIFSSRTQPFGLDVSRIQSSSTLPSSPLGPSPKQLTSWLPVMGDWWRWECSHLRVLACMSLNLWPFCRGTPRTHRSPCLASTVQ